MAHRKLKEGAPMRNGEGTYHEPHIKESRVGTFTEAATKHHMGVQEFASHVLADKDDFSPAMVKKANFARNASKFNNGHPG